MGVSKIYSIIHQIEIYSVDSTIQHFNNQGKVLYHQDKALFSLFWLLRNTGKSWPIKVFS